MREAYWRSQLGSRSSQGQRSNVLFRASVERYGRLAKEQDAICDRVEPQIAPAWNVPQFPVDAMVHGENLVIEVYGVKVRSTRYRVCLAVAAAMAPLRARQPASSPGRARRGSRRHVVRSHVLCHRTRLSSTAAILEKGQLPPRAPKRVVISVTYSGTCGGLQE